MADKLRDWMATRFAGKKSESPMESLFFAAYTLMKPHLRLPDPPDLLFDQQAVVGKYRADFMFTIKDENGKAKRLVVEIDGHDFHERTKDQAAHDKARDRWMTGAGYELMRFTGSEVWANPFACVDDVADRLHTMRYGLTLKEARIRASFDAMWELIRGTKNA